MAGTGGELAYKMEITFHSLSFIFIKVLENVKKPVLNRLCTLNIFSHLRKRTLHIPQLNPFYCLLLTLRIKGKHFRTGCNSCILEILLISVSLFPMVHLILTLQSIQIQQFAFLMIQYGSFYPLPPKPLFFTQTTSVELLPKWLSLLPL